jgi:hypothetical protein
VVRSEADDALMVNARGISSVDGLAVHLEAEPTWILLGINLQEIAGLPLGIALLQRGMRSPTLGDFGGLLSLPA